MNNNYNMLIAFSSGDIASQYAFAYQLLSIHGTCSNFNIVTTDHYLKEYCYNLYMHVYIMQSFFGTEEEINSPLLKNGEAIVRDRATGKIMYSEVRQTGRELMEFHRNRLGEEYCRTQSYMRFEDMARTGCVVVIGLPKEDRDIFKNIGGEIFELNR